MNEIQESGKVRGVRETTRTRGVKPETDVLEDKTTTGGGGVK